VVNALEAHSTLIDAFENQMPKDKRSNFSSGDRARLHFEATAAQIKARNFAGEQG
jgi:hypothetical protein